MDFFRSHLQQTVSLHQVMFNKLLFEEDSAVGSDLAALFQDVGNTYLRISQRIRESCDQHQAVQD